MNIWIVTTGSSDVQLKPEVDWHHLYRQIKYKKCSNHSFSPSRPTNADGDEPFQVPARVMGIVYIDEDERGYKLKDSILKILPKYKDNLSSKQKANFQEYKNIPLYSDTLFKLLQTARPQWKTHPYVKVIWDDAKDERNEQFHRLLGLTEKELFQAWSASDKPQWERKILGCLEFISEKKFTSLKEASLMSLVHNELTESLKIYGS